METYEIQREVLSDKSIVWNVVGGGMKWGCLDRRHAIALQRQLERTAWSEPTGA